MGMYGCDGVGFLAVHIFLLFYNNSGGEGGHCAGVFGRLIQERAQVTLQVRLDSESFLRKQSN